MSDKREPSGVKSLWVAFPGSQRLSIVHMCITGHVNQAHCCQALLFQDGQSEVHLPAWTQRTQFWPLVPLQLEPRDSRQMGSGSAVCLDALERVVPLTNVFSGAATADKKIDAQ